MNLRRDIDQAVARSLEKMVSGASYRSYVAESSLQLASELARLASVTEVLLVSSATAGLEACLRGAGVEEGSSVAMSAYDYPGNFWAIERAGARPLLIDVAPDSWSMDAAALEKAISGGRVQAVVASHLHGQFQSLRQLREQCDASGVLLIEDACQSVGNILCGEVRAAGGGSKLVGHVGLISFGGGKVLSAGRGGAVLSSDEALAQKIRIALGAGSGPYAMSELQAAAVVAQLTWLAKVDAVCGQFMTAFAFEFKKQLHGFSMPWDVVNPAKSSRNSFYQAGLICPDATIAAKCLQTLVENGCPAGQGFSGFHRRSKRRCDRSGDLANAESTAGRTLVIHHDIAMAATMTPAELVGLLCRAIQRT
ncbi:MAG: DegT/DnrJ/EryC1/StrS family aminotransferase [Aureliella sp.]